MSTVYTTINAPFKVHLSEESLAKYIIEGQLPVEFKEHIFTFFSEVSVREIFRFIEEYNLDIDTVQSYYSEFIKPVYHNKELEEAFIIE